MKNTNKKYTITEKHNKEENSIYSYLKVIRKIYYNIKNKLEQLSNKIFIDFYHVINC